MKKSGIILTILGGILIAYLVISNIKMKMAVSIIGGADGPTSVFLAGKLPAVPRVVVVFGIMFLVAGIILLFKKK